MQRFFQEHAWFILNAVLVVGLIALGTMLQGRQGGAPDAARTAQNVSSSGAEQVELGAPTKTVITAAPAAPMRTQPAPTSVQRSRPRIEGGELEDDD